MSNLKFDNFSIAALAGFAVALISVFLAWGTFYGFSISGWEGGDGKLVFFASLAGLAAVGYALYMPSNEKMAYIGAAAAGVVATFMQVINVFDILGNDVNLGIGIILGTIAAIVATGASVMKYQGKK